MSDPDPNEPLRYDKHADPGTRQDRRVDRALNTKSDPNSPLSILDILHTNQEQLFHLLRTLAEHHKSDTGTELPPP